VQYIEEIEKQPIAIGFFSWLYLLKAQKLQSLKYMGKKFHYKDFVE
jgi:hypothetical protein